MNETERIDIAVTFDDDGDMQIRLTDRGKDGIVDMRVLEWLPGRMVSIYGDLLHELERNNPDMSPEQCRDAVLWYLFDTYAPPVEEKHQ